MNRAYGLLLTLGLALGACSENGLNTPVNPNPGSDTGEAEALEDTGDVLSASDGGSMSRPEEADTDTDTDTNTDTNTHTNTDTDTDTHFSRRCWSVRAFGRGLMRRATVWLQ